MFASDPAGGVIFHAATGPDEQAIAAVQERVRRRLLRALVRRGLLPDDAGGRSRNGRMAAGFSCGRCA